MQRDTNAIGKWIYFYTEEEEMQESNKPIPQFLKGFIKSNAVEVIKEREWPAEDKIAVHK